MIAKLLTSAVLSALTMTVAATAMAMPKQVSREEMRAREKTSLQNSERGSSALSVNRESKMLEASNRLALRAVRNKDVAETLQDMKNKPESYLLDQASQAALDKILSNMNAEMDRGSSADSTIDSFLFARLTTEKAFIDGCGSGRASEFLKEGPRTQNVGNDLNQFLRTSMNKKIEFGSVQEKLYGVQQASGFELLTIADGEPFKLTLDFANINPKAKIQYGIMLSPEEFFFELAWKSPRTKALNKIRFDYESARALVDTQMGVRRRVLRYTAQIKSEVGEGKAVVSIRQVQQFRGVWKMVSADFTVLPKMSSVSIVDTKSKGDGHAWNEDLNDVITRAEELYLDVETTDTGAKITQPDKRDDFALLAKALNKKVAKLSSKNSVWTVSIDASRTEIRISSPKKEDGYLWSSELDSVINDFEAGRGIKFDVRMLNDGTASLKLRYVDGALQDIAAQLKSQLENTQWRAEIN